MKKLISLFLVICMLFGLTVTAYAAPRSETLYDCTLSISSKSNGVAISYTSSFSTTASEIGVKDIILYEKVNGSWKEMSIPSGSRTGALSYTGGGTYTGAVKGRTYKATCTHYAVYGGVTYTLDNSTSEFVYN